MNRNEITLFCDIINITNVENCKHTNSIDHYPVELVTVKYDYIDNVCDTIHGTYIVRSIDTSDKELLIKLHKCDEKFVGQCNDDNTKEFIEKLHCKRFNGDNTGPWYMLSSAMSGSKCGETIGNFTLDSAQLKIEYLENYLIENGINSNYHLYMMFHKKNHLDELSVRGCLSIEFNTIY